uniref:Glycine rich superfamily member n=1 Tax=Ascaris lumbricoides TaxID=6252 RepID=A0A0M3IV73_ASCLU
MIELCFAVIPYGLDTLWERHWEPVHYNRRYGSGADVDFNKRFDDENVALSARGSRSEWGNYNHGEHGDYVRGVSSGNDVAYGAGNAYNNGWGSGWGWGARRLQLPWGWNEQVLPRYWWTD